MKQCTFLALLSCLAATAASPLFAEGLELLHTFGGGHTNRVTSLALSPDGSLLASASADQTVKLWSVPSGSLIATFVGHTGPVLSIAFSPDGLTLASGTSDGWVRIWDVTRPNAEPVKAWNLNAQASSRSVPVRPFFLAFSPDSKTLATADQSTTKLWEVARAKPTTAMNFGSSSAPLVFSPNGKTLAIGTVLCDAARGRLISQLQRYPNTVTSVAFTPDGNVIVAQVKGLSLILWDVAANQAISTIACVVGSTNVNIWNGTTIGWQEPSGAIKLHDIASGQELATFSDLDQPCTQTTLSRDGATLAAAFSNGTIGLWDIASRRRTATIQRASFVALNPDANVLAWSDEAGALEFSDLATKQRIARLPAPSPAKGSLLKLSSDGKLLAWNDGNNTITLCETTSGSVLAKIDLPAASSCSASFCADNKILLLGFGKEHQHRLELWSVTSGKKIGSVEEANLSVLDYGLSPDGRYFAIGCRDSTLTLWDLADGTHRTLQGPKSPVTSGQGLLDFSGALAVFSADGKSVMAVSAGGTAAWDVISGRQIDPPKSASYGELASEPAGAALATTVFGWFLKPPGSLASPPPLALSPDRKTAVLKAETGVILQETATGHAIATLQERTQFISPTPKNFRPLPTVTAARFSPDGMLLALELADGTSRLHSAKTGSLAASIPGRQRIIAFPSHGHTVVSQSPNSIHIWNTWDLVVDQRKVR